MISEARMGTNHAMDKLSNTWELKKGPRMVTNHTNSISRGY